MDFKSIVYTIPPPRHFGLPNRIRTYDLRIRSPLLCPAELQGDLEEYEGIEPSSSAWKAEVLADIRILHWRKALDSNQTPLGASCLAGSPDALPVYFPWCSLMDSNHRLLLCKSRFLPLN